MNPFYTCIVDTFSHFKETALMGHSLRRRYYTISYHVSLSYTLFIQSVNVNWETKIPASHMNAVIAFSGPKTPEVHLPLLMTFHSRSDVSPHRKNEISSYPAFLHADMNCLTCCGVTSWRPTVGQTGTIFTWTLPFLRRYSFQPSWKRNTAAAGDRRMSSQ